MSSGRCCGPNGMEVYLLLADSSMYVYSTSLHGTYSLATTQETGQYCNRDEGLLVVRTRGGRHGMTG